MVQLSGYYRCFIFRRFRVKILSLRLAYLTASVMTFPHSLVPSVGLVPQIVRTLKGHTKMPHVVNMNLIIFTAFVRNTFPPSAEVKNRWSYTPCTCLHDMYRENSTLVLGTLFNICNVTASATVSSHLW
jgi:hypothetical protein